MVVKGKEVNNEHTGQCVCVGVGVGVDGLTCKLFGVSVLPFVTKASDFGVRKAMPPLLSSEFGAECCQQHQTENFEII